MDKFEDKTPATPRQETRQERLARALRENLRRRKAPPATEIGAKDSAKETS